MIRLAAEHPSSCRLGVGLTWTGYLGVERIARIYDPDWRLCRVVPDRDGLDTKLQFPPRPARVPIEHHTTPGDEFVIAKR